MRRLVLSLTRVFLAASLLSCATSGHKFEWRQVDALKPGMTVAEVEKSLGSKSSAVNYMPDGRTARVWMWSRGTVVGTGEARSVSILFDAQGRMVRLINTSETPIR
jgi:hypothetical protein